MAVVDCCTCYTGNECTDDTGTYSFFPSEMDGSCNAANLSQCLDISSGIANCDNSPYGNFEQCGLPVENTEEIEEPPVDPDCAGVPGGDAVIDECGICNGPGPTFVCWNGDLECGPTYCSSDYPWTSCVEQNTDYCAYAPPLQNFGEPDCFDVPVSNSAITNTTSQGLEPQTIRVCINNVDVGCMSINSDTFSETAVAQCATTCYDSNGITNQVECDPEQNQCNGDFPLCHDCCLYQGCRDGGADNYGIQTSTSTYIGSTLNQDCDNCCIFSGCTQQTTPEGINIINYDNDANTDDGSCIEENRKLLISPIHTFGYIYDTYSIQLIGEDDRENTTYLTNCNNFDLSDYDNPLYCDGINIPEAEGECYEEYNSCVSEAGYYDYGCQITLDICLDGGINFSFTPDCFPTGGANWDDVIGQPCGFGNTGTCQWIPEIDPDNPSGNCPRNCTLGLEPNETICTSQMYECNNNNPTCSEQECNFYFGVCYSSIQSNDDQFSTKYCNYDTHCGPDDHCMSGYELTFNSTYSSYVEGGACASLDTGMMDAIDSMLRECSIEDCNITDENSYCYVESGVTVTDSFEYQANRDVTCLNDPQSDILVSGEINSQIIVEQNPNKGGLYPTNGINVEYYTIEIYECPEGTNRENYLIKCDTGEPYETINTDIATELINGEYTYKFEKAGLFKFNVYTNEYSTVDDEVTPNSGNNITGFIDVSDVIKINQSIIDSNSNYNTQRYILPYIGVNIPHTAVVENNRESLEELSNDKRPMLGMLSYAEENSTSFWTEEVGDKFSAVGEHFDTNNNSEPSYPFTPDFDVRTLKAIQNSKAVLYKYYDPSIDLEHYNDNSAPAEARFLFYPRQKPGGIDTNTYNPFLTRNIRTEYDPTELDYDSEIEYYVADINWGDGNKEFETEPEKLDPYTYIGHHYEKSGIYEITGYMIRTTVTTAGVRGVNGFQRFSGKIYLTEETRGNDEFKSLGGDGFTFIPYKDTTPIIGGVSKNSMYYKSIARYLGYLTPESTEVELTIPFQYYSDRINIETALMTMDETRIGKTISHFTGSYDIATGDIGYGLTLDDDELNGHQPGDVAWNGDEYLDTIGDLGNNLGHVDIGQVRYFNEPIQMYELLGFTENEPGNPDDERYWKNIIPANTDIIEDRINNIYNSQVWIGDYYYPVLPKINDRGKFSDELQGDRTPFGSKETWDAEDYDAYITQEIISDDSLIIDMNMQMSNKLGDNVLEDNSGNQNVGITISDYKLNFDKNTYTPSAENFIKDITIEDTEDLSY